MATQASIVAFDGAATPVTHTFDGAGSSYDAVLGYIAEWREILATVPEYAQIKLTAKKRMLKNRVWRVEFQVSVPVMESVSGVNSSGYTAAAKVAYPNNVALVCYFSERATPIERRLARQLLINIVNGVATSVVPVVTGNVTQLIDSNIFPT